MLRRGNRAHAGQPKGQRMADILIVNGVVVTVEGLD